MEKPNMAHFKMIYYIQKKPYLSWIWGEKGWSSDNMLLVFSMLKEYCVVGKERGGIMVNDIKNEITNELS